MVHAVARRFRGACCFRGGVCFQGRCRLVLSSSLAQSVSGRQQTGKTVSSRGERFGSGCMRDETESPWKSCFGLYSLLRQAPQGSCPAALGATENKARNKTSKEIPFRPAYSLIQSVLPLMTPFCRFAACRKRTERVRRTVRAGNDLGSRRLPGNNKRPGSGGQPHAPSRNLRCD